MQEIWVRMCPLQYGNSEEVAKMTVRHVCENLGIVVS